MRLLFFSRCRSFLYAKWRINLAFRQTTPRLFASVNCLFPRSKTQLWGAVTVYTSDSTPLQVIGLRIVLSYSKMLCLCCLMREAVTIQAIFGASIESLKASYPSHTYLRFTVFLGRRFQLSLTRGVNVQDFGSSPYMYLNIFYSQQFNLDLSTCSVAEQHRDR
jgi:hypothetical protein